ncbi:MAG: sugar-transfer associated ATP-grasp domain-containing protein [Acidiphilium sp.]|nr:sugar-transfer associated ATP-grasp domain-containing protein [Acidiphilium sp.]MDD4937034.1 sugar-transfer associated ATP-grasp domain-containing protein [Acidiphilium sp.]
MSTSGISASLTDQGHPLVGTIAPFDVRVAIREAAPDIARVIRLMLTAGRLATGPGRLMPAEYFGHRLWDPGCGQGDLRRFVGLHAQARFHQTCCDLGWKAIADDKLVSYAVLTAGGIAALPETLAIVDPARKQNDATSLPGIEPVLGFLRDPEVYPIVAKPIDGVFSVGVVHALSCDPGAGTLRSVTGGSLSIPAIAAQLVWHEGGYLIQRALQPAAPLARITAGRLCSVRILVFLTPEGPVIHRAVLKIPVAANVADNYWREGNRIGGVVLATGVVSRVMTGQAQNLRRDPVHPDTGEAIEGVAIPDWSSLCDLVHRAALLFPGIRTQSWDVAVTDHGPVLLEINWGGDLNLHQIAHGEGVLDPVYCDHLRACGYRENLPA